MQYRVKSGFGLPGVAYVGNARVEAGSLVPPDAPPDEVAALVRSGYIEPATATVSEPQADAAPAIQAGGRADLEARTIAELRSMASERGLEAPRTLTKMELVERLVNASGA